MPTHTLESWDNVTSGSSRYVTVIFDDESYITKHPNELALIMKIPGIEAVVFYKTELNLAEEKIIHITKEYSKQKLAGFDPRR